MSDLRALIDGHLDGSLSPHEGEALASALAGDRRAIEDLLARAALHRALRRALVMQASKGSRVPLSIAPAQGAGRRLKIRGYLIAAGLLAAGALVAIAASILARGEAPVERPVAARYVASFVDSDSVMYVDGAIASRGEMYRPGVYSIESGSAHLLLVNRVEVNLLGRTRLGLQSPMSASMESGVATFNCPPEAHGYRVALPEGAEVVDLGTRFAVAVDPDGRARVVVLDGTVSVREADGGSQEFEAGQQAVIVAGRIERAADGEPSPIAQTLSPISPRSTFAVAADDLLQTAAVAVEFDGPATNAGAFPSQAIESLTNGPIVYRPGAGGTHESWSTNHGGAVTWRLDIAAAPFGYDIDRIDVLAGYSPSRIGHVYAISVQTVGRDGFVPLAEVVHPDDAADRGGNYERRATVTRAEADPLATGVTAIRFTFGDDNPFGINLGQSVFREIDVIGRPSHIRSQTSPSEPENANPITSGVTP